MRRKHAALSYLAAALIAAISSVAFAQTSTTLGTGGSSAGTQNSTGSTATSVTGSGSATASGPSGNSASDSSGSSASPSPGASGYAHNDDVNGKKTRAHGKSGAPGQKKKEEDKQ